MSERKPPGVSWETWVDKQLREAQERGEFDNLRGAGKPLPGRGEPDHELWWLKGYLAREKLDFALPTGLRLRKEIEDLPARLDRERTESAVRRIVDDLNERIGNENRLPTPGPPMNRMPLDVDEVVAGWRARRATDSPDPVDEPDPVEAFGQRRWFRRRPRPER